MEYIFVCRAGQYRSPTAVGVAKEMAEEYDIEGFEAQHFGLYVSLQGSVEQISERLSRADLIFIMEGEMANDLITIYSVNLDRICDLDIPDMYKREDLELKRLIRLKLKPFFKDWKKYIKA